MNDDIKRLFWMVIPKSVQQNIMEILNNRRTRFTEFNLKPYANLDEMKAETDILIARVIYEEIIITNTCYERNYK